MIVAVGSIGWGDAARTLPILKRLETDVTIIGNLNSVEFFEKFGYDCISFNVDYFSRDLSIFGSLLKVVENIPKMIEIKKVLEREIEKDKDKCILIVQDFLFSSIIPFLKKKLSRAILISNLPRITKFENIPENLRDQMALARLGFSQLKKIFDVIFYDGFKTNKGPEIEDKVYRVGLITRDFKIKEISEEFPLYVFSGWEGSIKYFYKVKDKLKNILAVGRKIEGVSSIGFVKNIEEYISRANYIISNAGLGIIGDCLKIRKPMLLIPIENHLEQYVNAMTIEKMGFGKAFFKARDLEIFLKNLEVYRENIRKHKLDLDGAEEIAKVINSWLG